MRPFHEVQACDATADLLAGELQRKGYVLVRGLLPRDGLAKPLCDITAILSRAGWLQPGRDPLDRVAAKGAACGDPDPAFKSTYQQVFNLETFHALPHHPALRRVMTMIAGNQLLIHPKPIGRLIFPNCERLTVHAHQDYRFMGGDPECFTAWIPLHDCPVEIGPLQVLEGSHRFGRLVHEDEDLHVPEISQRSLAGAEWTGGAVQAGDVLIFHSLTVHAASPNTTTQLRISIDCRFQDARKAINPANLAFAGDSGKSWDKTYAGWRSDELKYYWKKLPLRFSPTPDEIRRMAMQASSEAQRARFGRILDQLS